VTEFRIIPCEEWGAMPPRGKIESAGRPVRIIFHHTDGHHTELDHKPGESFAEAVGYARAVQKSHMSPSPTDPSKPWLDTGNNFLVTKAGYIFEGRHGSLDAINHGRMVVSAHCPGQNTQPGIEHEQFGDEPLTPAQREASIWLHAHICHKTGIKPSSIHGHREFFATACPGALFPDLGEFRKAVAKALEPQPEPIPSGGGGHVPTPE